MCVMFVCVRDQCAVTMHFFLGDASLSFSSYLSVVYTCLSTFSPRLQMQNELCQREREQERERELKRKREAGLEQERERAWEREREQDRELDRQKERQRERQQQMVRAVESHYLAELQTRRAPPEDRTKPGDRLTANRLGTYTPIGAGT